MRFIPFVNLVIIILLLLTGGAIILSLHKEEIVVESYFPVESPQLAKSPFQEEEPLSLEPGPLSLRFTTPRLLLPHLQEELIYHGTSERPDFSSSHFYLSFAGSDMVFSHTQNKPLYLSYKREGDEGHYVASALPTNLFLHLHLQNGGKRLDVSVHMIDEQGEEVTENAADREFSLHPVPLSKEKMGSWELGEQRVDSTLLIRQKARWLGADQFLQLHGGEEFSFVKERERIDFLVEPHVYSCFVKKGDMLIWKEGRWCSPLPGEATQSYPLLVVKKVEEKVIGFDLWDAEGKCKIPLNLIRARDMGGMPDLEREFRFVGAKSWAQFIVETGRERITIRPFDWLVLTAEGWIKLDNAEKIDDYLHQKMVGPLLVLDKMGKQEGKQVLTGHLFNSSRTEMLPVELNISTTAYSANMAPFYFKPQTINGDEQ